MLTKGAETKAVIMRTILQLYWLCMITLKIRKGFSAIFLTDNFICTASQTVVNIYSILGIYISVLVKCECVCYCAYFINANKLYVHVCVLRGLT